MTQTPPKFPTTRFRRMRSKPALRRLMRENTLSVDDLIWPVLVMEGDDMVTLRQ